MAEPRIPLDTLAELRRYVEHRILPGGFVYAVLCNDLYRACVKADDSNRACFFDLVDYVEAQLPIACRGSAAAVRHWLDREENAGSDHGDDPDYGGS